MPLPFKPLNTTKQDTNTHTKLIIIITNKMYERTINIFVALSFMGIQTRLVGASDLSFWRFGVLKRQPSSFVVLAGIVVVRHGRNQLP